jgi:hypothetical protein
LGFITEREGGGGGREKKKEKEKVKRKSQKKKSKSKEKVKVKRESQKQKVKGEKRKSKAEVKSEGQSQERRLVTVSEERSSEARQCEAAHPDDKSPCEGPQDAVRVTDSAGRSAFGCVRHGAVLLASLAGGVVHAGPTSSGGEAIEVYRKAKTLKPFEFGEGRS